MLTGDRAKYLGLIFAIAFCTFLLENQTSIFASILKRTGSQILDVTDADVWVMDEKTEYFEQTKALKDTDRPRVRGVNGVEWAVKLFKGYPVARTRAGKFAACILLGLDDATLTGAPRKMLLGSWERLREPDSIVIDNAGYILLCPDKPLELDRELEMNDHKVKIVGISDASAPFLSSPVIHTRYSEAVNFVGHERTQLSYVLVRSQPGVNAEEVCRRIEAQTGLRARTTDQFRWDCIVYYLKNTGIPVNFGITITIALIVGTVVAGQTFYLFTLENLKQFGTLKAIGVTNWRLTGMVLLQAFTVGVMGFGLGTGMAAAFFEMTLQKIATRGIILMWQSVAITGACILFVVVIASLLSIRRVVVLEPAAVFRGGIINSAISTRDLRKRFGNGAGVEALRGVNFEARLGELTFIVGPSGCGKTTLLSVITGLLDPRDGVVELFGSNHGRLPPNQRILFRRENIGFVFQQFNLLPALTAAENAAVPLIAAGMKSTEAVGRAKAPLDLLGPDGGGRGGPPALAVCDKPTAALDHATGEAVMKLVAANAVHPDRAAVVVTHASRVFHFADVIAHMDDGRIVKTERNSKREIQS